MKDYISKISRALDQLINTLFCGNEDEMLSSRAHWISLLGFQGWVTVKLLIDKLFFWSPNHCESAFDYEEERRSIPFDHRRWFVDQEF
jgi:hypothetical protein